MSTTTAKAKPARSLSYNRLCGVLTISQGKKEDSYYVDALRHDFGPAVKCVTLTKLPATRKADSPDEYAVSVDLSSREGTCECMGHLRLGHKTECRHVAAVRVLAERGAI